MSLSAVELLSVVFLPVLLGAALLRLQGVAPRTDPLAYWGWAWIQGCLGVAVALSAWLWLALPLRAAWIAPALLACAALAFALGRGRAVAVARPARRFPFWERLVFALALVLLVLTLADRILIASGDVLASSDEARIWAAKAKVMFHTGSFGPEFQAAMQSPEIAAHADYPPLNPLLQLWVHAHAGEIVHVESRLPIQLFGLAGILVAASALRRRARPLVAATFLVCIGTMGRFFTYQAFSDALIAITLLACWDLWQRYQEDGELVWLQLCAASATVLVWSKNEGMLQVLAFGLALLAASRWKRVRLPERGQRLRCLAWTVPLLLSLVYLQWFNAHFGFVNDLVQGGADPTAAATAPRQGFLGLVLERAAPNARLIVAHFANLIAVDSVPTHYLVLAFLGLCVLAPANAFAKERLVFTLGLLLALCGYMVVYLGTHWEIETHLKHSAHRLVHHLAPAAGLWVCLVVVEVLPQLASGARRGSPEELARSTA